MALTIPWLPRWQAWPVKLPLHLVAVTESASPSMLEVEHLQNSARRAVAFYQQARVRLIPHVSMVRGVRVRQESEAVQAHRVHVGGHPFTILSLIDLDIWRGAFGGEAINESLAVVAQSRFLEAYIAHELGHLFGLGHEDGTFMEPAPSKTFHLPMTLAQRGRVYERGWEMGSL